MINLTVAFGAVAGLAVMLHSIVMPVYHSAAPMLALLQHKDAYYANEIDVCQIQFLD